MACNEEDTSSSSMEAVEMRSVQFRVDNLQSKTSFIEEEGDDSSSGKELGVLLGRVESAVASLSYLRSKAKNPDSLVSLEMIRSIETVSDVLESLLRRVAAAESETGFQKERVAIGEEEIRRKTIQIDDLNARLDEMKRVVVGNKTVLDETVEIIKKLVEDSKRDRERAVENEEELGRMKIECESLRSYVNTSTNVIETLLLSERQFQTIEARLVAKSAQLEGEKAQKEVEVQKLMEENVKLTALLDKKEAQLVALNEQCKAIALSASNI